MSVPAFIDISEQEQAAELKSYLKKLGADIGEESSPDGLAADLTEIVAVCDAIWKENKEADAEAAFNSLLTLVFMLQSDEMAGLVPGVCKKLTESSATTEKSGPLRVKLMQNFLYGFDDTNKVAYGVFMALVKLAGQKKCLNMIDVSLDKVKSLCDGWKLSEQEAQELYRTLHEALIANQRGEEAMQVMVVLLGLSTKHDSSAATKAEATTCVVECLKDPDCLLFDHLLKLKPVESLRGDKIHDLLDIFVSGTLSDYCKMAEQDGHPEWLSSLGLDSTVLVRKMRILTFISLANTQTVVTYDEIKREMQVDEDDVEAFVIEVVGTGKVRARLDQWAKKVNVQFAVPRQFSAEQWVQLGVRFGEWKKQLIAVQHNLDQLRNIQLVPQ